MKERGKVGKLDGPPSAEQQALLLQLITAGFIDRVARLDAYDPSNHQKEGAKYTYTTTMGGVTQKCFIHPSSNLFKTLPFFVVYQEIIKSKSGKCYLCGVSTVESGWLRTLGKGLVSESGPLSAPPPKYDEKTDRVVANIRYSFGSEQWPIGVVEKLFPEDNVEGVKIFARALLEGRVIRQLKWIIPYLSTSPLIITKGIMNNKVVNLLQPLAHHKIRSKKALVQRFRKDQTFLLHQILAWVSNDAHPRLRSAWPYIE